MGLLLYLGGMGSKKTNFYVDLTHRFGFGDAADEVQSLFLDGKKEEAFAAIPDELVVGDLDDRHRGRGRRARSRRSRSRASTA